MQTANGRKMVEQAWRKCVAGKWNLGKECLTSDDAFEALMDYMEKDPVLANEICQRTSVVYGLDDAECDDDDDVNKPLEDDNHNTAVPLHDVVQKQLGLDLDFEDDEFMVTSVEKDGRNLIPGSNEENIWAYDDFGEKYGAQNLPVSGGDDDEEERELCTTK